MEPFARIPLVSDDYENSAQQDAVDVAAERRRRSRRKANLGTFTGYRWTYPDLVDSWWLSPMW